MAEEQLEQFRTKLVWACVLASAALMLSIAYLGATYVPPPIPEQSALVDRYPVVEFTPATATTYTCVAYRGGLQCLKKEGPSP